MTESPASAGEEFFAALQELRRATSAVSYATLVRQAAAQQPPLQIGSQRLSDWFGAKAVPTDPAVVRFLVEYLQPKVPRTSGYQQRRLSWWLNLHQTALRQRQANRDGGSLSVVSALSPRRLGLLIDDCDPLVLEVHPAIQVPGVVSVADPADALPAYVLRAHDGRLRDIVDGMLGDGRSQLITLVGGSSTGKTRAGWELAEYLDRKQPGRWRLWHPYDPTRPQSVLAGLQKVGPDTIVWLNEAQDYLMPSDPGLAEKVAAGLRSLLQDPGRGPVLVLATLWPDYWSILTTRPAGASPDVFGQARELLTGTAVTLADAFTPAQIASLAGPDVDARVRYAAQHIEGGRITQYLAGAPELESRYRTAVDSMPGARAILQVAIDARRLGHPLALPHALLEQAAPGYLDDDDWDTLGDDWLESALAYTAQPCKGARGPLTRIRTRPGRPAGDHGQPCYRLADYLEQLGRDERGAVYPPETLWATFAATITDPDLLHNLGRRAEERGRYQHAIWLYNQAARHGDTNALREIVRRRERAGDRVGAETLALRAADDGNTGALVDLALEREYSGDTVSAESMVVRAADFGSTTALVFLAEEIERSGNHVRAEALYRQAADLGSSSGLLGLAKQRDRFGDRTGADALYRQAADLGHFEAVAILAQRLAMYGDRTGAEALYRQGAALGISDALMLGQYVRLDVHAGNAEAVYRQRVDQGDTRAMRDLAEFRNRAGNRTGAEALYRQAIERGDTSALPSLAKLREQAGDRADAEALYRQAIERGDTSALPSLAKLREQAGDRADAEALYRQAIERGDTSALPSLAKLREQAGDTAGASQLRRFGLTGNGKVATSIDFASGSG
ncbi:hypothetical protein ACTOB_003091 [Actinoplanes oblitus]|uniref:Uncharacterized protein n=1 Tax=Actinoplanes oblitus TaxID=3040509 RepID=A0ABY8WNI2_9ACTN|nr:hypothetical protein [Actinoplanes oblitus]WIM99439.1 hypothetical protein ACTOB_003091 [Actinoplanes oblitus]